MRKRNVPREYENISPIRHIRSCGPLAHNKYSGVEKLSHNYLNYSTYIFFSKDSIIIIDYVSKKGLRSKLDIPSR